MMWPNRCTCPPRPRGPPWDDGSDMVCSWCEDIEGREWAEAFAEDDPPTEDELEDAGWFALYFWQGSPWTSIIIGCGRCDRSREFEGLGDDGAIRAARRQGWHVEFKPLRRGHESMPYIRCPEHKDEIGRSALAQHQDGSGG